MSTPVRIQSKNGVHLVEVTRFGQLVTAPLEYSTPVSVRMTVANQAYNLVRPEQLTGITITAYSVATRRSVGINGAEVIIYEADAADSLDVLSEIQPFDLPQQEFKSMTPLNILATPGRFINAKSDDVEVIVTLHFYRVPDFVEII